MADQKDPPDIRSVFADPDFRQLSGPEKINALNKLYPDFNSLPLKEKAGAIQTALQKIPMASKDKVPGFWGTIGGELSGMVGAARERFQHPFQNPAPGMLAAGLEQAEQFVKAGREFKAGQGVRGAGYVGAGLLPLAGPAAAQAGEEFQRGEKGAGAAHTLMLLGPDIASAGVGLTEALTGKAARAALRNRLTPVQQTRLAAAEARAAQAGFTGPVATRGESAGVPWVRKVERTMQHTPGAAGRAEDFYTARAGELERQARQSVEAVAPKMPPGSTPVDVATDVYHEGETTIRMQKRAADEIYDEVRARAAKGKQSIRIGTKWEVRADGTRIPHPIIGTYEAPVPLKPFRTRLQPLYNEFLSKFKDLDEAQKMANPGYASLRRIMTDTDPLTPGRLRQYMGAMDLESELRSIKQQLRDRRFSNFLFSPSGRVQLRILNEGYAAVNRALDEAQAGTSALLQRGQKLVQSYKNADALLTQLVGKDPNKLDPMGLYNAMTPAGDKKLYAVTRLAQLAPNTSKAVARMYLEGLINTATKDAGRLKEGVGTALVNGFDRLGPKTKQVWFGPQLTDEINTVFHNIKDLMPAEGAPTAFRYPAMLLTGAALEVFQALFTGQPMTAIGVTTKTAASMGGANIMARILFSRGGGATVSRLVRAGKIGGAVLREATRAFEARVAVAQQEQREEQERAAQPQTPQTPAGTQQAPPAASESPAQPAKRGASSNAGKSAPRASITPEMGQMLATASKRTGVELPLLRAMVQAESAGNARAVSPKGAIGPLQLMPGTARDLNVDPGNVPQNIEGGARFMAQLLAKYHGNKTLALAAYNAGPQAVQNYGGVPPFQETQDYVNRVLGFYRSR